MTTFSHIEVCGNIGDVEVRNAPPPSGRPYLRLTVAVDEEQKDGQKKTVWYTVIVSNKAIETPERLLKVFRVGRKIFVRGSPRARVVKQADGSWVAKTMVLADSLPHVLDPKPKDSD